ncbi:MAG: hypothetical protein NZM94_06345, partial [Roseiflexus sp.]|nr:hypothetical protein [Roseiflexus sp.]
VLPSGGPAGWAAGSTTYAYNAVGLPITITLPNGVTTLNGYDAAHRLISITHRTVTGTLAAYVYTLDAVGNRTAITETVQQPGSTATVLDSIFADSFESGNFGAWTSVVTDAGSLTVSTTAALSGTYGLRADVNDANAAFGSRRSTYIGAVGGGATTTTVVYTYDALSRLTDAVYSTGDEFHYGYDAVGNVLTRTQKINGVTTTTIYTYNAGNQLVTAQTSGDPTVWRYRYDGNGSLVEVTPNGTTPANGARRYTYNAAGHLIRAEQHDGSAYRLQAEMHYTGRGERVRLLGWTAGLSAPTTKQHHHTRHPVRLAAAPRPPPPPTHTPPPPPPPHPGASGAG